MLDTTSSCKLHMKVYVRVLHGGQLQHAHAKAVHVHLLIILLLIQLRSHELREAAAAAAARHPRLSHASPPNRTAATGLLHWQRMKTGRCDASMLGAACLPAGVHCTVPAEKELAVMPSAARFNQSLQTADAECICQNTKAVGGMSK